MQETSKSVAGAECFKSLEVASTKTDKKMKMLTCVAECLPRGSFACENSAEKRLDLSTPVNEKVSKIRTTFSMCWFHSWQNCPEKC